MKNFPPSQSLSPLFASPYLLLFACLFVCPSVHHRPSHPTSLLVCLSLSLIVTNISLHSYYINTSIEYKILDYVTDLFSRVSDSNVTDFNNFHNAREVIFLPRAFAGNIVEELF